MIFQFSMEKDKEPPADILWIQDRRDILMLHEVQCCHLHTHRGRGPWLNSCSFQSSFTSCAEVLTSRDQIILISQCVLSRHSIVTQETTRFPRLKLAHNRHLLTHDSVSRRFSSSFSVSSTLARIHHDWSCQRWKMHSEQDHECITHHEGAPHWLMKVQQLAMQWKVEMKIHNLLAKRNNHAGHRLKRSACARCGLLFCHTS